MCYQSLELIIKQYPSIDKMLYIFFLFKKDTDPISRFIPTS